MATPPEAYDFTTSLGGTEVMVNVDDIDPEVFCGSDWYGAYVAFSMYGKVYAHRLMFTKGSKTDYLFCMTLVGQFAQVLVVSDHPSTYTVVNSDNIERVARSLATFRHDVSLDRAIKMYVSANPPPALVQRVGIRFTTVKG